MVRDEQRVSQMMGEVVKEIRRNPGVKPGILARRFGISRESMLVGVTMVNHRVYGGYDGIGLYYDEEE